jgi:hypothetical protein
MSKIVNKIINIMHWIGFLISCFMLVFSALDQSKDETIIHIIASMIPITVTWLIACFFNGKKNFLPFR